ncbi:MAG: hypothetical protein VW405_07380 [Rhodospirillaceae bacterium]
MSFQEMQTTLDALRGLPFPPTSLQTHWIGLKDLPLEALQAAVAAAAKRCERFPSPAELRQLADEAPRHLPEAPSRVTPLQTPKVLGTLPTGQQVVQTAIYEAWCVVCGDTGWEPCVVFKAAHGMPVPEGAPAVRQCGCWSENPVLVRKRESHAKYAAARTKGRGE